VIAQKQSQISIPQLRAESRKTRSR
jgi:hypothetical protein